MKKKIMHIVQSAGGVEVYIKMLLKYMDSNKYEHILVCSNDYYKNDFDSSVKAFEQIDMVREINFKKDYISIKKVRKLIKNYNPDIIYSHSSKGGAIGRIANIRIGKKQLYNPHGWAFNMDCSNKKKKVYTMIEKFLSKFTSKIVAISEAEKDSALQNKICNAEKIEVIFNGIDIDKYNEDKENYIINRNDLNIPEDAFVVGMVGRISRQKSPDIFVKAARKIKDNIPNAFFIIVGDGDEREEILQLITKLNLEESFLITGWVDNPMEYIQIFDLAMLISRWEGFGLAIAEYMVSRKPIVATDIDAIPNLIKHDESGYLAKVDNVDTVVGGALKIYKDSVYKEKLVNNAFKRVNEKFDIKRVAKEHEKLIDDLSRR
ncbi:glycosyltransferase family 4 protein [Clostridium baratii]|uniref:glycosyltransferase family 4 protein n=1 Tax=Clostridium baratii TaxID=1561 RepID=UPI00097FAAB9|nr:glycosyltransferase family 4 protein [Clostridium baratii]AQM61200.1 glycosyltransferase [Clostridium baratii]